MTIPVAFFSAAAFFYIEEVGVLIEERFWVLALEANNRGISRSLDGIVAAHKEIRQSKHHSRILNSGEHVVITFEGPNGNIAANSDVSIGQVFLARCVEEGWLENVILKVLYSDVTVIKIANVLAFIICERIHRS